MTIRYEIYLHYGDYPAACIINDHLYIINRVIVRTSARGISVANPVGRLYRILDHRRCEATPLHSINRMPRKLSAVDGRGSITLNAWNLLAS